MGNYFQGRFKWKTYGSRYIASRDRNKILNDIYGIDPNCYETYKNGFPEGPFYTVCDQGETVKGNLTYKPSSIVYLPAKRVVYVGPNGDSTTAVIELREYK